MGSSVSQAEVLDGAVATPAAKAGKGIEAARPRKRANKKCLQPRLSG